ncbi:MAG: hypothetical protein MUW56_06845 [Chryseobacterium sp.]|uniref:hypothetical protein n=1 Tax=Chryseobacterium sp. TaxID=1871047 RepID=UPI0025C2394C|nr:hypothetical protein [Chryseobacterium sp.]MCJ7933350.1 hypothetical protein [Chryseobacterium sp.]
MRDLRSKEGEYISVFKEIFGDQEITLNYSGILVIPTGKFIESANFGYADERYTLMTIQKDAAIKEKEVGKEDFIQLKINQFEEYKKTEAYRRELQDPLEFWELSKKRRSFPKEYKKDVKRRNN